MRLLIDIAAAALLVVCVSAAMLSEHSHHMVVLAKADPLPRLSKEARPVISVGIFPLDQIDLPVAFPELELLLARNGFARCGEALNVNEAEDLVLLHEPGAATRAVLFKPRANVVGDANVECPVVPAGEDVDAVPAFAHHLAQARQDNADRGNRSWLSPGRRVLSTIRGVIRTN